MLNGNLMHPMLRAPIASDYATIALWIPDEMACARWAGPHLRFPFAPQELPELLVVPDACSFSMTMSNNIPLGFGQFWRRSGSTVHLGRIIVSPHERGRGYGKMLCKLLMAEALRATAAETITLRVYRDNTIAQSIYSSLGFRVVESESDAEVFAMEAQVNQSMLPVAPL